MAVDVWFEFSDRPGDARRQMAAAPRVGESVLWVEQTREGVRIMEDTTEYVVESAEWVISQDASHVLVRLALVPNKEQQHQVVEEVRA
ncbi:hypothetical protein [Streptomyces albireticuli]|uniref:Uncharacterized protein n=1 Tax=Streptomyces albireticuli TaxID=1940 RepID=A0A2A2D9D2_9ACTN|nr:hypothetical protein [Streptomyces albireticuli]MCD9145900.1 hypothetical protein [Streptomyces albireticuli]MCD9166070.1 hypothetical protein [Streptomyces albireticuli]MCD9196350.1 hypothetical protein [Streptomyces albireticuli]PAU47970.1 hypothetical protein CK936_15790 [Streptomyces albireticuli]